jgi:hypothetical protein
MRWLVMAAVLCGINAGARGADKNDEKGDDDKGVVSLFDGKTLKGWIDSDKKEPKGYAIENGVLVCLKSGGGNLYTEKEYADFVFRFEFKLETNANNGVGLRAPLKGDAAYVGMESQILDDSGPAYKDKLQPYQYHGSIYGVAAAKTGYLKPVGEWNSEEITCHGRHVKVVLNGETIVDVDLDKAAPDGKTIDGKNHPGLKRDRGHIGFLGHGARIEFRNLRIKEIEKK